MKLRKEGGTVSEIKFLTSNSHKMAEAKEILDRFDVEVIQQPFEKLEIQSDDIVEIAEHAMEEARNEFTGKMLIEDAGLFIPILKDFPGTLSKYVFLTIGCEGVLKLLEDKNDRRAEFRSVLVYSDDEGQKKTFIGKVEGTISGDIRGENGFAFDKIFIANGSKLTFAELSENDKNQISHRSKSFEMFAKWIKSNGEM